MEISVYLCAHVRQTPLFEQVAHVEFLELIHNQPALTLPARGRLDD